MHIIRRTPLAISVASLSIGLFIVSACFGLKLCAAPQSYRPSVLFMGDSHVEGTFGSTLDLLLRTQFGESVATFGVGGSTPAWWLSGQRTPWGYFERLWNRVERRTLGELTPHAEALIEKYHPNIIIVELGTNFIWNPIDADAINATKKLMRIIEAKTPGNCFWVGPPALGNVDVRFVSRFQEVRNMLPELMREYPKCVYIDSTQVTRFPNNIGDHIHFDSWSPEGVEVARNWAQEVMKVINRSISNRH